ncbi:MAG: mismatch repair protein [Acidobacteriales bacterium]|nr:mismatch repair protein [Terriglobales bacterium]
MAGAGLLWAVLHYKLPAVWLLLPLLSFFAVAVYHSRVLERRAAAERAVAFYQRGMARLEDRWAGTGQTGDRFTDPHHVYSGDLDLFGRGGLFELLSLARTRMGEDTLASWLLSPSPVDVIRERQAAVSELRESLDLREDLAVTGEVANVRVHGEALAAWAESAGSLNQSWLRPVALLLALLALGGAVVWGVYGTLAPMALIIVIEGVIWYRLRSRLDSAMHGAEHAFQDLDLVSSLLQRVERESHQSPLLGRLHQELSSHHVAASAAIAKLRSIVQFIDSRDNVLVKALDIPMMYSVQVGISADRWRRAHGHAVARWLSVLGEFEALLSLAAYAFEHPADTWPEFASGTARLEAARLGHPLLPAATCVRNDLAVGGETRVLLVSGSNMSGKSTMLRAVGINTVLAMAGAPVRAEKMTLTPLQVGASIRVNDSLQEGSSRFYTEITRLRKLLDLTRESLPLLFLLDEVLQGTNSHDRLIGAEGILRGYVERGAIGMVTTHDLALTGIDAQARNVHFQDEFLEVQIHFDYILRPGVVTKSTGLELMRSVGLDV